MPSVKRNIIVKVIIDVVILLLVAVPVLLMYTLGTPVKRGFFCDDDSIRYPYKDSTITSGALYAYGTLIPVISIIIIEFFHVFKGKAHISLPKNDKIQLLFWYLYRYIGVFFFGCAVSQFSVDICKYSVGRLRPHFIDICNPDWNLVDCSDGRRYITDDVCARPETPEQVSKQRDSRLSFFSGHSSFAAFTMFYLIIYLQARLNLKHVHLFRPFFQFICFAIAVYTSLTRIYDYKHHWSDVLVGFLNGVLFAFCTALLVAGLYPKEIVIRKHEDIKLGVMNGTEENQSSLTEASRKTPHLV